MTKSRPGRVLLTSVFAGLPLAAAGLVGVAYYAFAAVPPVPVPPQNLITEQKRVLGKILFFDEQLSTSNTVACATCHVMSFGGNDPRIGATNPGPDNIIPSPDDRRGSPGVARMDASLNYVRDPQFNFAAQVTGRSANSPVNAAYNIDSFWDGRARSTFRDPITNAVLIPAGGSLESQAVGPIMNSVEMGHDGINWDHIVTKLPHVQPLQLATNLPQDVAAVLANKPSYPELFAAAFGDGQITPARIGMAIATCERTLISNQAPFDLGTMTAQQIAGRQTFVNNCAVCHDIQNGLFTDNTFRNIGLRPPAEDLGRQAVTNAPNGADRGRFKVPGLRNVGLKRSFMHTGRIASLTDVVRFYVQAPGSAPRFLDNIDPAVLQITPQSLPQQQEAGLVDFLANALTDPRVANQQFPFDRPTLFTERPADRASLEGGTGVAGTGGVIPGVLPAAVQPPAYVGNSDYRFAVFNARPGATAHLYASLTPPIAGRINTDILVGTTVTGTAGQTSGVATVHWPLTPLNVSSGQVYYLQWVIEDPVAAGGQARSVATRVPIFCGAQGCPLACGTSDYNGDGDFGTDQDIEAFFACLGGTCCPTCYSMGSDFNGDGDAGTDQDIEAFFRVLGGGSC